jgi:hypothetical protein
VQVSPNGSGSHVFEFLAQAQAKDLKGLTINDFTLQNSHLYMVGNAGDATTHVLEYATTDGQFEANITLDDAGTSNPDRGGLTVSKIGIMPSGEFLIFGVRTSKQDLPDTPVPQFTYKSVLELYARSGKFLKAVSFDSDQIDLNKKGRTPQDNFVAIDLALTANGPDGVYVMAYSNKPIAYVVSPAGEIARKLPIEPLSSEYRPINLSISENQMLLEFVKSADGPLETRFVTYDINTGDKLSLYKLADDLNGIFSCYDGRRTFTFISTDGLGQRVVKVADAR